MFYLIHKYGADLCNHSLYVCYNLQCTIGTWYVICIREIEQRLSPEFSDFRMLPSFIYSSNLLSQVTN